jgi:hypothetical protein
MSPAGPDACPVCQSACRPLGSVDFNRSCELAKGVRLPPSGRGVEYLQCTACGFAFAPELHRWKPADFSREIYNDDYAVVDPDHRETRPRVNSETLAATFGAAGRSIRHLDYGGGAGRLAELMTALGWHSTSFDPFFGGQADVSGRFHLITCFEVFEHVADPAALMARLRALMDKEGLVLASTLVSDGQIHPGQALDWWYAAPRNGHISLHTRRSLALLATGQGLETASFSPDIHLFWRGQFPRWARHLLKGG